MAVTIELDVMLARRTTLDAICRVLDCQPGDVLRWTADRLQAGMRSKLRLCIGVSPAISPRDSGGRRRSS